MRTLLGIILTTMCFNTYSQLNWSTCPWNTAEFPFETLNRRFAWSSSLFLPSQIGGAQSISSIQFRVQNAGGWPQNFSTVRVYLRHTSINNYANGTHPDPTYGSFTQVYSGNLNIGTTNNTVYTITFNMNAPFSYNGADQLEILIENHSNVNSDLDAWFTRTDLRPISDGIYNGKHGSGSTWASARDSGVRRTYSLAIQLMGSCGAYPLPVELDEFFAACQDDKIQLNWSTATELNNDFFTIEKSIDGKTWREIAQVKGNGTVSNQSDYGLKVDSDPQLTYYRLSQTDFNGESELLRILAVDCHAGKKVVAYPNPFDSELIIDFDDQTKVSFYNTFGQLIDLPLSVTGNVLIYDTSSLPSGVYVVQLDRDGVVESMKVIK